MHAIAQNSWDRQGNAGINSSDFIGTTDNKDLIFKANNLERAKLFSSGNFAFDTNTLFIDAINNRVGFGTASPSYIATIVGNSDATARGPLYIVATASGQYGCGFNLDATAQANGRNYSIFSGAANSFQPGSFAVYDSSASAYRFAISSAGRMLIGALGNAEYAGSLFGVKGNAAIGLTYCLLAAPVNGFMVEGNTLIGTTTNAGYKLDVNGTVRFGSSGKSEIKADGSMKPVSMADSAATNDSFYFSTTAAKLVYKDASGTVNTLY